MRYPLRLVPLLAACVACGCGGEGRRAVPPVPRVKPEPSGTVTTKPTADLHPTTRPARKVVFKDTFSQGSAPSPKRWRVSNPAKQRVVVESGALVVRSESRGQPTRVEFQVQEPLPALGRWRLEFDALINSLWGKGQGEVRVELRDSATCGEPDGNDFVLAERHWDEESGLKFGIFRDGAFAGWHEVAPPGELGAWHHYRVDYQRGVLTLWRDGERALDCDVVALLDRPLTEGVTIELGFHVPEGSGIEGCIDNVTVVAEDEE